MIKFERLSRSFKMRNSVKTVKNKLKNRQEQMSFRKNENILRNK